VVVTVEISFGRWLQRRRKALDLTQEELAQRVGCAAETLRKIEADVRRPSRQIAERLAEALEIPEPDRAAFVKAARAELAVDRLKSPTQDIPSIALVPANTVSSEVVSFLFTQISSTFQTKPFDGRCPYKGLDVFEEEDAELFFGRESLVEDLVKRVKESRTVFITGPSGSGKSSLVRAGLIHSLKQGAIKDVYGERWLYETIKPGREPIEALALVFSRLKSPELANYFREHANESDVLNECAESVLGGNKEQRLVLFIDQFEEVFTQVSKDAAEVFIDVLANAAVSDSGRVTVLFAMRSDFVSNCARYPALNKLLNQQFIQIGAMQSDELVSAIAQPALRVGLRIDPDLVAQIINDMQGEPGALPLMQFALKDLFDSQQTKGGMIALTLPDYLQHGGIHKSLERHADGSFAKLNDTEQELARSIFSRLIEIGRGTQDTRRTALFDELIPTDSKAADVQLVIRKLADARLITTDEQAGKDTVTISHEKLIDAWPWLRRLVDENRETIAVQNEIASDAKEWEDHKRDSSYLYAGGRLTNVREQLAAKKLALSGLARQFVQAGHVKQRRSQLILVTGISMVIVLLIFAVIVFRKQAIISRARELAAQSVALRDRNFGVSLLLGVEAFNIYDTVQTRGALMDNVYANPQLQVYLSAHSSFVTMVVFSPDGKLLASGSVDGTIILWNVESGQPVGEPLRKHTGVVSGLAFSPDGKLLASSSQDGTIILWDVKSGQPIGEPLLERSFAIYSVAFSPDGKTIASGSSESITLWEVKTGQPIGEPLRLANVRYVVFSPDGKTIVSSSPESIILWDVESGQPIGKMLSLSDVASVAFSPDGKLLALGGYESIILVDVEAEKQIGELLHSAFVDVYDVAFSPDGKTLASSTLESIILWDVESAEPIGKPLHSTYLDRVAFSPDGKTLASSTLESIILWDVHEVINVKEQRRIGTRVPAVFTNGVAFSPDGKRLALNSFESVILWDVESDQPIGEPLRKHTDLVLSVAFSPDGKTLASGSSESIILWDVESGQPIGKPIPAAFVNGVVFSPDGKLLATSSAGSIVLRDVRSGHPIGKPLLELKGTTFSLVFSPDGKLLASGSDDGTLILWDVESGQPIGEPLPKQSAAIYDVAFSPDGKILASASRDGTILLWDVESGQLVGKPLRENLLFVYSLAFSPDGKTLASSSSESIILWDVETGQPIGEPLREQTEVVFNVAFSPDGKSLLSFSDALIIMDVSPLSWIQKTCQRVHRNFTRVEWERYFPNEEYRKTCEQWPLEAEAAPISIESDQMVLTNNSSYFYILVSLWVTIIYFMGGWANYRLIFANSNLSTSIGNAVLTWKHFILAAGEGGVLIILIVIGIILTAFGLFAIGLRANAEISPYTLLYLVPGGLWTGGVYGYLTRFHLGKFGRVKRTLLGSLAGFLATSLSWILILMVDAILVGEFTSLSTWLQILFVSGSLGGVGSILSALGASIYIFGFQNRKMNQ
jgi:WD40 repeat protein/transcriptional regulator with XRE-family HTH domain